MRCRLESLCSGVLMLRLRFTLDSLDMTRMYSFPKIRRHTHTHVEGVLEGAQAHLVPFRSRPLRPVFGGTAGHAGPLGLGSSQRRRSRATAALRPEFPEFQRARNFSRSRNSAVMYAQVAVVVVGRGRVERRLRCHPCDP